MDDVELGALNTTSMYPPAGTVPPLPGNVATTSLFEDPTAGIVVVLRIVETTVPALLVM